MEVNFGSKDNPAMETVITRKEYPMEKAKEFLANEVVAVIGYGVQGPAQAMNLRDNGINVIVGQRESHAKPGKKPTSWERAIADGWVEGETLFPVIEEAAEKGTIVQYLLSDAGQKDRWGDIKPCLKEGNALYFSHGFSLAYADQTEVIPPEYVDVILVAPKGSGRNVRINFLNGDGINSSYAVEQDFTGRAEERAIASGIAIGSGYLFPTTAQREAYSDLTGERGILMGALYGMFKAQFDVLIENGHSLSEAFNETIEELTQSLIRLVDENGIEHMFANCSTTAQRGALDWAPKFQAAAAPVFKELYKRVADGTETRRVLEANSRDNYRETLDAELDAMKNSDMGLAGTAVRKLRPGNQN